MGEWVKLNVRPRTRQQARRLAKLRGEKIYETLDNIIDQELQDIQTRADNLGEDNPGVSVEKVQESGLNLTL